MSHRVLQQSQILMICQNCQERDATVFLTEIENKKKVEFRLCEKCARDRNKHSATKLPPLTSVQTGKASSLLPNPSFPESVDPCSACGLTLTTFRTTGRLGCAHDYEHFKVHLVPLIERIHKSSQHVGKVPTKATNQELQKRKREHLEQLIKEQQKCIAEEKYERAAELRDMISELEEECQRGPSLN